MPAVMKSSLVGSFLNFLPFFGGARDFILMPESLNDSFVVYSIRSILFAISRPFVDVFGLRFSGDVAFSLGESAATDAERTILWRVNGESMTPCGNVNAVAPWWAQNSAIIVTTLAVVVLHCW